MKAIATLCVCSVLGSAAPLHAGLTDLICDDTDRLERQIAGASGARKEGQGMRGPDALIEVWIEPHTGDWTLVQNYANGTSCILAMGAHWETLTPTDDPA